MATYYEQLKLPASASTEEITAAIDALYNQWRHLATNPQHSAQAQHQLQLLEAMRDTLTDPAKRIGYDASIGVVGGLIDPAALIAAERHPSPPPGQLNVRMKTEPRTPAAPGANPWTCYKCSADNPPKTPFCFQCGAKLVQTCPECGKNTSLVASKMCGSCGYHYDVAQKRVELRKQIEQRRAEVATFQQEYNRKTDSPYIPDSTAGCVLILFFIGIFALLVSIPIINSISYLFNTNPSNEFVNFTLGSVFVCLILFLVFFIRKDLLRRRKNAAGILQQKEQVEQNILQTQQMLDATDIGRS